MKRPIWIVAGLIAATMGRIILAEPAVPSHDDSFSKDGLFKANVAKLTDTQLVAQPDVPLDATKNVLWCGTLQLAWNKAIGLVGEKLQFENQPPVVDLLNRESFTTADLDPGSYVALADFERNHVEDEIRAALEKTFHGAASPELIPAKPAHPGPDDFVAYAYLYKNLNFAIPFERNPSLNFGETKVKSFGFTSKLDKLPKGMAGQVSICDYNSPDDFVIQLKTKTPGDQLILAKVTPGATLQATIESVLKRSGNPHPASPNSGSKLEVPLLNFDLRRDFSELEGLILKPGPNAKIHSQLVVSKVEQLVRFQLNEKGAILKSEAVVVMMTAMAPMGPPPYIMRFDKPFLILMKRADSAQPYFALWVGNASLLIPADKS